MPGSVAHADAVCVRPPRVAGMPGAGGGGRVDPRSSDCGGGQARDLHHSGCGFGSARQLYALRAFFGYACRDEECASHKAGFAWADRGGITDVRELPRGRGRRFNEGCRAFADDAVDGGAGRVRVGARKRGRRRLPVWRRRGSVRGADARLMSRSFAQYGGTSRARRRDESFPQRRVARLSSPR